VADDDGGKEQKAQMIFGRGSTAAMTKDDKRNTRLLGRDNSSRGSASSTSGVWTDIFRYNHGWATTTRIAAAADMTAREGHSDF
jgi:hypothetical protein